MVTDVEIIFKDGSSRIFKNVSHIRHLNHQPVPDTGGLLWHTMEPEWWREGEIEIIHSEGKDTISGEPGLDVIYR